LAFEISNIPIQKCQGPPGFKALQKPSVLKARSSPALSTPRRISGAVRKKSDDGIFLTLDSLEKKEVASP
jgi:hypothetical protein